MGAQLNCFISYGKNYEILGFWSQATSMLNFSTEKLLEVPTLEAIFKFLVISQKLCSLLTI